MNKDEQIKWLNKLAEDILEQYTDAYSLVDKEMLAVALYNIGCRKEEWISVDERLPTPFVSVLVYMPDETPHPTVREGFIGKRGNWYAGGFDRLPDEVVAWRDMPEPPKMKGGAE